ncbi:MAG: tRNA pseudouridine(55) synthase TruB [Betaproteobacteria bacterium]|nr:tRNA pseudouridine(55) synthase TruB [Betaproteobacteria bacterium]
MSAPRKPPRRRLNGVLLLDKPLGLSSNHALQAARRLYSAEKAGHTGTLDPLATGLLPLCFGEATKFSGELLEADKRYLATVQLGVTTETADAEGAELERRPVAVSREQIDLTLAAFVGQIEQVPPMYSALKRDGKPLYEYARAGIEVERVARRISIHQLHLVNGDDGLSNDRFDFEVRCSKGTYVRTLAADIGERLGCGAHLAALRRTGIGALDIAQAHTLAMLEELAVEARDALLLPPDALLADLAEARLDAAESARLRHGQAVRWSAEEGARLRVYDSEQHFIGVGRQQADGWLLPQRLVAGG